MFTGLIEKIGTIRSIENRDFGQRLVVSCSQMREIPQLGASISISGCCLTVAEATHIENEHILDFDVVMETMKCTTLGSLEKGDLVNVEQALQANARIGGHFVQGHIDCVENILHIGSMDNSEYRMRVSMNTVDVDAIVPKGSIAIDGVSLTIASVTPQWFDIALIPTTLQETTLGKKTVDDAVNIETDILARTITQFMRHREST